MTGHQAVPWYARYLCCFESTERKPGSPRCPTASRLRCGRLLPRCPPSRPRIGVRCRVGDGVRDGVRFLDGRCWIESCSISARVRWQCKPIGVAELDIETVRQDILHIYIHIIVFIPILFLIFECCAVYYGFMVCCVMCVVWHPM